MIRNPLPRFEPLTEEDLETLDHGWERLAKEVGVRFDHPEALRLFAEAGQTVDETTVRFDPGFLRTQAALAPSEFRLRARNPERNLVVGGDAMVFCAAQGPPFVRDGDTRRDGTFADLERFLMLTQASGILDTPGRGGPAGSFWMTPCSAGMPTTARSTRSATSRSAASARPGPGCMKSRLPNAGPKFQPLPTPAAASLGREPSNPC
jgi:hypothetical protein